MSFAPALIGAVAGIASTALTNSANAAQNRDQRIWSQQMSDTEMQRRVRDLKAAGLNPMLAVNGGGAGATYGMPNVIPMQNASDSVGKLASSAMEAYMKRSEKTAIDLANANAIRQGENIEANTDKARAEAGLATSAARLNDVNVQRSVAETELATTNSTNAKQQFFNLNAEYGKITREIAEIAARTRGQELENQQKIALQPLILRLQELENKRLQLNLPRMENESKAQDSWWMRKVSPYLPDILKSAGAGAAAGSAYRAVK